jgi:hypothetical protein
MPQGSRPNCSNLVSVLNGIRETAIQLLLANFIEIENVTMHSETMSRFQIVIGIAMVIAVLLVFAHPATFGLPTPPPSYSLFLPLLLIWTGLITAVAESRRTLLAFLSHRDPADERVLRLALTCTLLC